MTHEFNSDIFKLSVSDKYDALINPTESESIKIINKHQSNVYNLLTQGHSVETVAELTEEHPISVNYFYQELKKFGAFIEEGTKKELLADFGDPKNLSLWLHVTDACNMGCSYCYISTLRERNTIKNDHFDSLKRCLLRTAKEKNLKRIHLKLAGGEPFTKFNAWKDKVHELYELFKGEECHLQLGCLTNLSILTDEIVDFIKSHKMGLGISLDGYGDTHNKSRPFLNGKGSFDTIEKNLKIIEDNNIPHNIMVVVSDQNLEGLLDLTKFLVKKNISFRFSDVKGNDFNRDRFISELKKCYSYIDKKIETGYKFSKKHSLCDLGLDNPSGRACSMGRSGAAIYFDGSVHFCHTHFGQKPSIGHINQDTDLLSIIARGKFYARLNSDSRHSDCKKCKYRLVCGSGCPVYRTEDNKSPECAVFHSILPTVYKLRAKEKVLAINS